MYYDHDLYTLFLHSLAEPGKGGVIIIDRGPKHCPVDTRNNVLYSLGCCTQAEVDVLKDDRKDVFLVIVCCVELALAVVGVDVLVGNDSYDALTVLQPLTNGAVPVTPSADILRIQPYRQPIYTRREYNDMMGMCAPDAG